MIRLPRPTRRERPPADVAPGERVLAWCRAADGEVLAGTRDALHLPEVRIPWEEVQAAEWDSDDDLLVVSEVGTWGEERPVHSFSIDDPGRLLELVRERVTASVVLQRHVPLDRRRGLRVVARRAPHGNGPIRWIHEYDEGVDPDDPEVRAAARDALELAQRDVGLP